MRQGRHIPHAHNHSAAERNNFSLFGFQPALGRFSLCATPVRAEGGWPADSLYMLDLQVAKLRWSEVVAQGGLWPDSQIEPSLAWAGGRLFLFAGSPRPMGEIYVRV